MQSKMPWTPKSLQQKEILSSSWAQWKTSWLVNITPQDLGRYVWPFRNMFVNYYNYYKFQKEYYQAIADDYQSWYDSRCPRPKNYYYFKEPWHVDFSPRFPQGVDKTMLDGFFPATWLLGSTCECKTVVNDNNSCPFFPCNKHLHNNKTNHCHYLDTILLPVIESYQVNTTN